jgi:hypothetical protein
MIRVLIEGKKRGGLGEIFKSQTSCLFFLSKLHTIFVKYRRLCELLFFFHPCRKLVYHCITQIY